MSIQTKNNVYDEQLTEIFDKGFKRLLKSLLKESIKKGRAWLHVYYDEEGHFRFKSFQQKRSFLSGKMPLIPNWTRLSVYMRLKHMKGKENNY